ncbi:MAG: aminotransferase class V-fold PLP-dependent enzyme [Pseudomonadota bacterium]
MGRIYLDHNATMPLRAEARAAMVAAMDVAGNPSSVHAEGRAARALIERSRASLAASLGTNEGEIVFVSGATEAAALLLAGRGLSGAGIEHDAVRSWISETLPVDGDGQVRVAEPGRATLQLANSETGALQTLPRGLAVSDWTQAFGKVAVNFDASGIDAAFVSAHKLGGPKGVGAVVMRPGLDLAAQIRGGGQEMGRRAGTENVVGIAGFAAAAAAAVAEVADGLWDRVAELRNILENSLELRAELTNFVARTNRRLPNTTCLVTPGWRGETQVMQMDLAGFAVSAGSACASGKVSASTVLRAMGQTEAAAGAAIRVSLGPQTTRAEVDAFVKAWTDAQNRFRARAA